MMKLRRVVQVASAIAAFAIAGAVPAQAQVRRVESGRNAIGFNVGYFTVAADRLARRRRRAGRRICRRARTRSPSTSTTSTAPPSAANGSSGSASTSRRASARASTRSTVHSVYAQKVRDDGSEIAQDLKLRIVPLTRDRALPADRSPRSHSLRRRRHWRLQLALQRGRRVHLPERRHRQRPVRGRRVGGGPVVLGGIRFPVATCGPSAARFAGRRPWERGSSTRTSSSSATRSISAAGTTTLRSI